jgi:hypothetical protein
METQPVEYGVQRWLRRLALCMLLPFAAGCGGQVLSVALPQRDPNTQAHFVCKPSEKDGRPGFDCASGQNLFSPNVELSIGDQCPYGVARLWVETDWQGDIEQVQFVCATAPVDDLPED